MIKNNCTPTHGSRKIVNITNLWMDVAHRCYVDCGMGWYLSGVRYRAPYSANKVNPIVPQWFFFILFLSINTKDNDIDTCGNETQLYNMSAEKNLIFYTKDIKLSIKHLPAYDILEIWNQAHKCLHMSLSPLTILCPISDFLLIGTRQNWSRYWPKI